VHGQHSRKFSDDLFWQIISFLTTLLQTFANFLVIAMMLSTCTISRHLPKLNSNTTTPTLPTPQLQRVDNFLTTLTNVANFSSKGLDECWSPLPTTRQRLIDYWQHKPILSTKIKHL